MKNNLKVFCLVLVIYAASAQAQMSGTYNVPTSFTSIAAAISSLNAVGVSGPVSILIPAGYTETAPAGGYSLGVIVGASSTNSISFQRSGSGVNPLITAYTGTATPSAGVQDGVWWLVGTDYVTIDGIDITDPNTTNPATMEFGYGLYKASASDGCQNNTIKNCVITLNRVNNAAAAGPVVDGSRGIDVVNATAASNTVALTITSASGANSNNKFYSNTIQNCNIGIALIGYAAATPFALADTGNDIGGQSISTGNTILNFGGGGTVASAGIRTLAQYGINVAYNTLNNNNGSGALSAQIIRGIYLNTAVSANATITNNTVTIKGGGTTQQVSVIENVSGATAANNTITITNNLITNCTNATNTSGTFYGILNSASAANLVVTGNIFTNNTSNATSANVYLIYNSGAVTGVVNMSNNNLSYTFNNATVAFSGTNYNIYNSGGSTTTSLTISNNNFSAYSFVNVLSTGIMYFVYNTNNNAVCNINNNTWTNLSLNISGSLYLIYNSTSTQNALAVTNNSIVTGLTRLGGAGTLYCYYSGASSLGTSTQLFSGNNFSNITATVSGSGSFYGIYSSDGSASPYPKKTVVNNIVSNNFINTTSTTNYGIFMNYLGDGSTTSGSTVNSNTVSNLSFAGTCYGLYINSTASPTYPPQIFSNSVNNFTCTGASSSIYGSYVAGPAAGINYFRNKINNIYETGATGLAYGLYVSTGTNLNFNNNLVGNIYAPSSTGANRINGIYINGGTSMNFYFNSVYLDGVSTGANFGSNALYSSTTPNLNLVNNLLVNNSTPTGTEYATSFRRSSTTLTTYSSTSNNNIFYAGTPGTNRLIFYDGTNAIQTLGAYKTFLVNRDGVSFTENPTFVSTVGSNPNYLNINTSVPTQIESGAQVIAGISGDYAGTVRNGSTPDIGAWEGNYILNDITAPSFISWAFTSPPCNLTGRTFTASLYDFSGVASGSLTPRFYYKINSGAYSSVSGTLTSGTFTSGVWTFNVPYSVNVNDIVSYYLVAQDNAAVSNLSASPGAGFAGTDVNTITTPPSLPNSYPINTLNGIYTVGSGGTFTTLTAAAYAYNNYCISGPVTFSLVDALYSTSETFPVIFQNFNNQASATNSLLIIPASGVAVSITPTNTSIGSVIKFIDARYITIDGLNTGGSSIAINNANISSASANIWLASSNTTGSGNKFIGIKNLSLKGGYTSGSNGVIASIDGAVPSGTGGSDNDNITITGNSFLTFYHGILAIGSSSLSSGGMDNWIVSNNLIGPAASSTSNIGGNGLVIANALNLTVSGNTIRNLVTSVAGVDAINLNSYITGFSVSQNTINNIYSSSSGSGVNSIGGIYMGPGVSNGTVNLNLLSTIASTNTSGYGARGIIINTDNPSSNIHVRNNMISDIYCYADVSTIYWPVGISIDGATGGGINVDFNSVHLSGSYSGYSSAAGGVTGSAPLCISAANGNINIRNNIFSNTYDDNTFTADINYGIYSAVSATNFTSIDYNNYYVGGTGNNPILGYLGSNQTSLYSLQLGFGFGQNLHSLNFTPQFISNTDLHLVASSVSNAGINNVALPLSGITIDIDGQTRSTTAPDMGADEFTATGSCTSAVGGVLSPAAASLCTTQTVLATPANISSGIGTSYQWKIATNAGGPYSNITTGTGTSSPTYFSAVSALTPGVYYVVFQTSCASPALTGLSNEATVTIVPPPTTSISSTASLVCQGNSATLTANGATSYLWSTGSTASTIAVTPTATTVYTLTGSNAVCSIPSTISLVYSVNPTITVTSATTTICSGVPATLTASGASTYSWSNGATSSVINPTLSTATNYTTIGFNTNGCVSSPVVSSIAINPSPTVSISGSSGICTGQTATLTASGAVSYSWSTGSTSPVINDAPATNTVYFVTGINSLGCSSTVNQSVTVASSLPISIAGPAAVCPGSQALLTANGGVTYVWNSGATTSTIAPVPGSTTSYTVTGYSGTCSNTAVHTVSINPSPTITINGNFTTCSGISTTFTAGGATTYSWNNGINTASVSVAPTTNTSYVVTGTNSLGCSSNATAVVTTNTLPVITIAQSATSVCLQTSGTFTASGASTYSWNGGPNTATHTVIPTGSSVYTVSGANPAGCISSKTVALGTYSLPVVSITPVSATVCSLSQANFTASGASSYTWSNSAPNNATVSYTPVSASVYTVTGTSSQGCVATGTVAVATNSLPVITISPASATVCALSPASFTASGASTYTWNSAVSGSTYISGSLNGITNTVVGQSSQGCSSSMTVGVVNLPLPTLAITPSFVTLCHASTGIFTVSGATSYTWENSTNAATVAITPLAPLSFSVVGTGTNGCSNSASAVVLTNPLPTLTVVPASATVCPNDGASFSASGAVTYTWSNAVTTSTAVITPSITSVYTVSGSDVNGCVGTKTVSLVTKAVPSISISPSSASLCLGGAINFTASGANTYTWDDGSNLSIIFVSPSVTTSYTVSGKNNLGCFSSATVNAHIWQLPTIGVTPNSPTICVGETVTLTATGADTYTWSPLNFVGSTYTNNPKNTTIYTVIGADVNDCVNSGTVSVYVDKCTGFKENVIFRGKVNISPNPSTGQFKVSFGFEGPKEVMVLNSIGAMIMKSSTDDSTASFDLSGYAKGVYFVHLKVNGNWENHKVIIQ